MIMTLLQHWQEIALRGFLASCAMATLQEGLQALGFSRMSFPFLIGTFFTGNRRRAEWMGFICYLIGGIIFALGYDAVFQLLGHPVSTGLLLGLFQGLFMLIVILPLLPSVHPRMASPYDGPESERRIEPPGFMALHYGIPAPVIHLIGQMVFGLIIGASYPL